MRTTLVAENQRFSSAFHVKSAIFHLIVGRQAVHLTALDPVLTFTLRPHLWGEVWHATRRDELGACGDLAASFYAPTAAFPHVG
jgi:hypothetical protein